MVSDSRRLDASLPGRDPLAWRSGKPWPLLEREAAIDALAEAAKSAASGAGRVIFVSGEAGIGKSALLRQFASLHPECNLLTGACEPLSMPDPLGPLFDIAPGLSPRVQDLLEGGGGRTELFAAIVRALQSAQPAPVLCIEDIHWADHATLELLRYLGRRAERTQALTVATFRQEEAGSGSPLSIVLGDLATAAGVQHVTLAPLSEAATRILAAGTSANIAELHRLTGGNPFFITEVLAAGESGVPASVRDAVLARTTRLAGPTREAIEAAAAIGPRCSADFFGSVLDALGLPRWTMRAAVFTGFMRQSGNEYEFRHALAQSAIAEATALDRLQSLHQLILQMLLEAGPSPETYTAVIAHAQAAGDAQTVARFALPAAARAATLGAHREAAALYGLAMETAGKLTPDREAELAELQGEQLSLASEVTSALEAFGRAASILRRGSNPLELGRVLSRIASLTYLTGQHQQAEAAESEALHCLESQPPCRELAIAYESRAHRMLIALETSQAKSWAARACAIARQAGANEVDLEARVVAGAASLMEGLGTGTAELEACLKQSISLGRTELAARSAFYLAWLSLLNREPVAIDSYVREGLAICEEHDLGYWRLLLLSVRARLRFLQGHWAEAVQIENSIAARRSRIPLAKLPALALLGRLVARSGSEDPEPYFEEAASVADQHGKLESLTAALPARVEAAWLAGDVERACRYARSSLDSGFGADNPWWMGELRCLLRRLGQTPPDGPAAEPYRLEIEGDWEASAAWWEERGCAFEAAMALALGDDAGAVSRALAAFERMGAAPAAALARSRLRSLGVAAIPRGPRPSTSAHPAGLTRREQEVLELIASGLTNSQIGARLFLSPKTVERHVSSLLAKLGVSSRSDAVASAQRLGSLPQTQPEGASLPN
jgi:DNA-binding CsgD family transcriptional regulator